MIEFIRAAPNAIPPMPADRSALGTLPFAAAQYCEAICAASAWGHYAFSADDITIKWTGNETLILLDGGWRVLQSYTPQSILDYWRDSAPGEFSDSAPPFVTALFIPGVVQLWTGFLVRTAENWSTAVRPLVNMPSSAFYSCFDAIVETDQYGPWPLFMNIRLNAPNTEIFIQKTKPLFQVQAIPRESYIRSRRSSQLLNQEIETDAHQELLDIRQLPAALWKGYAKTVRPTDENRSSDANHAFGNYAAQARQRARKGSD
jgi:Family of unknown function (DUF6065)